MAPKRKLSNFDEGLTQKKIKIDSSDSEMSGRISDIASVIFKLIFIGRIKSLGNYRELPSKKDENSSIPNTDQSDAIFTFVIQDNSNKTPRASAFNEIALSLKKSLKVGELYKFEHFYVRPTVRTITDVDSPFEMEIRDDTVISPVSDIEDFAVLDPEVFTKIKAIRSLQDGQKINIQGEVTAVGTKTTETSKKGTAYCRQEVSIDDDTKEISIILWGPILDKVEILMGQKVIIRNLEIKSWKGSKQVSVLYDSTITISQ